MTLLGYIILSAVVYHGLNSIAKELRLFRLGLNLQTGEIEIKMNYKKRPRRKTEK